MAQPDHLLPTHASAGDPPPAAGSAADRGTTRTVVEYTWALRLPHERDESTDSGVRAPSRFMRQAGRDLADGQADLPRGPASQRHYSELTAQAGGRQARQPGAPSEPAPHQPRRTSMNDAKRAEDQGQSSSLPPERLARKREVLHRARADHAIKGEPTSGLPKEQERSRAEDVAPPPRGQTDQTR